MNLHHGRELTLLVLLSATPVVYSAQNQSTSSATATTFSTYFPETVASGNTAVTARQVFELGQMYKARDAKKAFVCYEYAAKQGYARAQWKLGYCFQHGFGVAVDLAAAVTWYERAAKQGLAAALCNLGVCYEKGLGVAVDMNKAIALYEKAAEKGDAVAQCNLGIFYHYGNSVVAVNAKKAFAYYQSAAKLGYAKAQCNLGVCYEQGFGVDVDTHKAVEWYTQAALQGDARALYNLGGCHKLGRGVEADYARAVELYRQAAKQGNEEAQKKVNEHTIAHWSAKDISSNVTSSSKPRVRRGSRHHLTCTTTKQPLLEAIAEELTTPTPNSSPSTSTPNHSPVLTMVQS